MHAIEVDDEVFEYLKAKAEAFIDTPNSVLRRLLFPPKPGRPTSPMVAERPKAPVGVLPPVPPGTPKALEQILQVAYLVRWGGKSRLDATHYIADRAGVFFQTVLDKYCRQLDLKADQFDALLRQEDLSDLRRLLARKFHAHANLTETYLAGKAT